MVNAFSFCLFGTVGAINNRVHNETGQVYSDVQCIPGGYYHGLEENVQLIEKHFPGWRVYVYLGNDVPDWFEEFLRKTYSSVVTRRTGTLGYETTVHRFFAADEPDVDVVFFRDADSRVHWRDRWAIRTFLSQSESLANIIRDHPYHSTAIAAGTWGIRKGLLTTPIRSLYESWIPVHNSSGDPNDVRGYGIDQNFLDLVIYHRIARSVFVIFSNGCVRQGERAIEFPFSWGADMHVGRVESLFISDNFWMRELDDAPPPLWNVVIPPVPQPPAPAPAPATKDPKDYVWHRLKKSRA